MGRVTMSQVQTKSPEFLGEIYWQRLQLLGQPFARSESLLVRALDDWQCTNQRPKIAIVGTRRPTSYGLRFISTLVEALARNASPPPVIISGGALGTDAWAHECALKAGLETESWVVGPIRNPNPRANQALFASIIARGGALLCPESLEPQGGVGPFKSDWVLRNAYLVARADVVIVPEANQRSGTWSSVRWANKMGIPVFALPGPVDRGSSEGTNVMISSGYAHPVQSATKLMEDLVVEGVLDPYNKGRDEELAAQTSYGLGSQELEQQLCAPGGIQVVDLPGLSEQLGLKLEQLCEYLLSEIREGKLHRKGNGFERRG